MKNCAEHFPDPHITAINPAICLRVIKPRVPQLGQERTAQQGSSFSPMWPAFSSTKIVPGCIWSGIHSLKSSSSATISPSLWANPLLRTQFQFATNFFRSAPSGTLAAVDDSAHLAHGVTEADCEHGLPGIFQDVNDLLR